MPHKSDLSKRVLTAVILIPCVLGVLLLAPLIIIQALIVLIGIGLTYEWVLLTKIDLKNVLLLKDKIFLLGQVYIFTAVFFLSYFVSNVDILLWFLIITWVNDTGAYFSGRLLKGPKLWVAISPKKTWSGLLGGVLMGGLASGFFASVTKLSHFPYLVSFCLSFIGHAGDLLESAAKRYYKVKDSGQILPGHGGLLDRLDSLLLMSIVYGFFFLFFLR